MKRLLALSLASLMLSMGASARPKGVSSSEILHRIQGLKVLTSVLYVAAHPDDENTLLLSYLANGKQAQTAYLSLTRGDGGQNLIGPQLRDELGIIRTQELLAARSIDGAIQFFSRADDFGYSKSPKETLRIWDKEAVLGDLVWTIRHFQPDVIITRFSLEPGFTHGHHTASAMLAKEAFSAANDPNRFPDQLQHTQPWQSKRILWNLSPWYFRQRGLKFQPDSDALEIPVGGYNPLLGHSFQEIAAASRSMHKSQGFGTAAQRENSSEYLALLDGVPAKTSMFEDIDTTWERVAGGRQILSSVKTLESQFDPSKPYLSVPALLKLRKQVSELDSSVWKTRKTEDIESLIADCLGLRLRATASKPYGLESTPMEVTLTAYQQSPLQVAWGERKLPNGTQQARTLSLETPSQATHPYWLRGDFDNPDLRGTALGKPELETEFQLQVEGNTLNYRVPVTFTEVDPVLGELVTQFVATPPVSLSLGQELILFSNDMDKEFAVQVEALHEEIKEAKISLELPPGWSALPTSQSVKLQGKQSKAEAIFKLIPPKGPSTGFVQPTAEVLGKSYRTQTKHLDFPHFPKQVLHPQVKAQLVKLDLKIKGRKVGYLAGAGDGIPEALKLMGYEVVELDPKTISPQSIEEVDTIVMGIRAYNVIENIPNVSKILFAYVKDGGTLITQYNTNRGLKSETLAPYNLELSRDRVTDETAEVTLLNPKHPLLTTPNPITSQDFDGWVQERGLYFPQAWAPELEPLLSCADPGEEQLQGGLLVGRYGKGHFVYTGYSWFRQLPAGVPGAYRLFANMVSLGHE